MFGPTGRLEEGQRLVLLDQLRGWCADSRTTLTIKPVIDLNTELTASGYAIPDRIRQQVTLRDRTCVFAWCTRPARSCDLDHVVPTTITPTLRGDHNPARPCRRTSPHCADTTTGSRPTPPGATPRPRPTPRHSTHGGATGTSGADLDWVA